MDGYVKTANFASGLASELNNEFDTAGLTVDAGSIAVAASAAAVRLAFSAVAGVALTALLLAA